MSGFSESKLRKLLCATVAGGALALACGPVMAQVAPGIDTDDGDAEETAADEDVETLTVTGSRLRRNEFNSVAPLQVIDGEAARAIGLVTTSDFITQSTVAAGAQLDGSFSGGSGTAVLEDVPTNGLGGASVQLRGLEPERTLVLLNGRRLAPSGVRGAPTQPSLNNIPTSIIQNVEILTDGASSIYGADAVAGVVNIITRDDFEGFEVTGFYGQPEDGEGTTQQYSGIVGSKFDNGRGNFVFAGEYFERERIRVGDRDSAFCRRSVERTPSGSLVQGPCNDTLPDAASVALGTGFPAFLFWVPNADTSTGIPNIEVQSEIPFMNLPDGLGDASLNDFYNLQDERREADLITPLRLISMYTSGEYDVDIFERDTLFWEFSYSNRQQTLTAANEQIFPGVPSLIPQENGQGGLLQNPDGSLQLFQNPLNPYAALAEQLGENITALPVFTSPDFNQVRQVEVDQYRAVLGMKGDLFDELDVPGLSLANWTYEFFGSYSRSQGFAAQPGFNEPNLALMLDSMRLDADGNVVCGAFPGFDRVDFGFLAGAVDCVVVPFFDPRIIANTENGGADFNDAEENFLIGLRTNRTVIDQAMFSAFFTGDIFEVPAGVVPFAIGFEFREDSIESQNDFLTTNFQLASESANEEGNTIGSTSFVETFMEVEIPLLRDLPLVRDLTVNASTRWTEEENFGALWTYSVKGGYSPVDWLTFRGTFGTSFRAPNLREQFLAPIARSESQALDPCRVPNEARTVDANGIPQFDPTGDERTQSTLNNCIADGIDPTALGLDATANFSVFDGGATDLEAETSTSWTAGFTFQQPWFDAFDFDLAFTWFNIDVEDSVESFSATSLLSGCFNQENRVGCERVTRSFSNNPRTNGLLTELQAGFFNLGQLTAEGFDMNGRFAVGFDVAGEYIDIAVLSANSFLSEQTVQLEPGDPIIDNVGLIGTPEWQSNNTITATWNWLTMLWRTRLIGAVTAEGFVAGNASAFGGTIDAVSGAPLSGFIDPVTGQLAGQACLAAPVPNADDAGVLDVNSNCVSNGNVDDYWIHDVSFTVNYDEMWRFRFGINNVFDREPPLIDDGFNGGALPGQIFSNRNNVVTSGGYDLVGRTFFASVTANF